MQKILKKEDLGRVCSADSFRSLIATDVRPDEIIGQERAVKALKMGLGIKAQGFNIYVSGASGTGKLSLVLDFVEHIAAREAVPYDWCYVNNFKDPYCPSKLQLPAGRALEFQKEMKSLIFAINGSLVKAFESEEYIRNKEDLISQLQDQQAIIMEAISEKADAKSFKIKQTSSGMITIPLKDNKPLTDAQLNSLSEKEIDELNERQEQLRDEVNAALIEIRKNDRDTNEALDKLTRITAESSIKFLISDLAGKFPYAPVEEYLSCVKKDVLEGLAEFLTAHEAAAHNGKPQNDQFLNRYAVTVLVNSDPSGHAPLVVEKNPTYNNLLGRVEKESYMGMLVTDHTMIRKGSLHESNGGYLVIRIEELFKNYFAWEGLKRALKNKEIVIEEATDQLGYLTTKTLKPEPIPLNVKVILIGDPLTYQLLYQYDSDFKELFKVKADFDSSMEYTEKNVNDYSRLVLKISKKEGLLTPDGGAIARIVEYGCRLAESQKKLSTRFGEILDILREAHYYAALAGAPAILDNHISKAIEEKVYRSNLIHERINEMIAEKQIIINVQDEKVGQLNGLCVVDTGDISFGMPARITCTVGMGREGIVAIEREAELSGPIHTKGVLILSGYLASKFMQDKPLSLAVRLVFEQSYSEIEGDSASSAELYAILSALSYLPIKQGIAATGSVNQRGEIQPVGGINEKIEGYFEVCKLLGLNGEQGVIIPAANVGHLALKEEVQKAVEENKFTIWAVETIEDGIGILTGVEAGSIWEGNTVFGCEQHARGIRREDEVVHRAGG
jgi:predicted ATP-dependent protease